jgi:periplasmic divalent cation tolerance protein
MTDEVVIFVTCPEAEAERLASSLVEERLVACVNIIPSVLSVYRWEEKLCKETESLLVMKSHTRLWHELEPRIRELHTYDVPEIISIPIKHGHMPYLDWVNCQLRDPDNAQPRVTTANKEV